jgi:hypothetical protein
MRSESGSGPAAGTFLRKGPPAELPSREGGMNTE